MNHGKPITSQKLMDFVLGKSTDKAMIVEEFQLHNDELLALVDVGEYAIGTHTRFEISKKHLKEFVRLKYDVQDMDFRELNYEFIKDYEFYLKTAKKISNNTAVKYITNFKKIVLRAIDKEIITHDPFKRFKAKKVKVPKKPLSSMSWSYWKIIVFLYHAWQQHGTYLYFNVIQG